ncbi:cation transporter [Ileibacterium valens]|uniref:cation transporter n=1 Tax=Ileibacterium valens TaxID=1862668 RepID=UPI00259B06CA|nr:cation transporter [Ileibacterium valens]
MRKIFKVEVDCPTCAAKLEDCVSKINGVDSCSVNLMTQKLIVNAEAGRHAEIIDMAIEQMKKIDDDVVIYA